LRLKKIINLSEVVFRTLGFANLACLHIVGIRSPAFGAVFKFQEKSARRMLRKLILVW